MFPHRHHVIHQGLLLLDRVDPLLQLLHQSSLWGSTAPVCGPMKSEEFSRCLISPKCPHTEPIFALSSLLIQRTFLFHTALPRDSTRMASLTFSCQTIFFHRYTLILIWKHLRMLHARSSLQHIAQRGVLCGVARQSRCELPLLAFSTCCARRR